MAFEMLGRISSLVNLSDIKNFQSFQYNGYTYVKLSSDGMDAVCISESSNILYFGEALKVYSGPMCHKIILPT